MRHGTPLSDNPELSPGLSIEHAKEYVFVLLRHRWLMAVVFAGILAVTCVGTLLQTPLFKATALVRIDRGKINLVQDTTTDDARLGFREFYGTQRRVLTSRTLAQRTLDQLDAWGHPLLVSADDLDVTSESGRDKQIDRLLKMLMVTHVRETQLIEATFITPDPDFSRDLANALVREYIAYSVEAESGVARNTSSFIREQIEKLQREILEKEMQLQRYGEQQDVSLEQSDDIVAQQLSDLHHELTQAQSKLAAAEARYVSLRQSDPASAPEVFNNQTIQELRQERGRLSKQYAELGAKYQPGWPEMKRLKRAIEEVDNRVAIETQGLAEKLRASARTSFREAQNRVGLLKKTLEQQRAETRDIDSRTGDYQRIRVELESRQAMLQQLTRREGETGLSAELSERQHVNVQVVEEAVLPRSPFKPNLPLNLLAGVLAAMVLAPGIAFFVNFWDTAVRNSEDLRRYASAPCLVTIPHFAREKQIVNGNGGRLSPPSSGRSHSSALAHRPTRLNGTGGLTSNGTDSSVLLERFKFLRNALLMSSPGNPPKSVLLTSGSEKEGKSFVSSNVASSFAQLGNRVLLIDADLRKPSVHKFFGVKNSGGLTNVIIGQQSLEDGCIQETHHPNLYVLLAGSRTPSPAELLGSRAMQDVLKRCCELFDFVVIDSAPLFPVVDSHVLASIADKVMLVARSGSTQGPAVQDALEVLERSHGNVAGVVLNDVDLMDFAQSYYYRHYSYTYAPESRFRTPA